jgi:hypothetical protein
MLAIRPTTELGRLAFFSMPVISGAATLITHGTCWLLEKKGVIKPSTTYIVSACSSLLTYLATAVAFTTLGIVSFSGAAVVAIPALVVAGIYFTLFFLEKKEAPFDKAKETRVLEEFYEILRVVDEKTPEELVKKLMSIHDRYKNLKNLAQFEKDVKNLQANEYKNYLIHYRTNQIALHKVANAVFLEFLINDKVPHIDMANKVRANLEKLKSLNSTESINFDALVHANLESVVYLKKHNVDMTPLEYRPNQRTLLRVPI